MAKESSSQGIKVEILLELDEGHLQWLSTAAKKYDIPSIDKALRIVLSYAKQSGQETLIFEKVRCIFCNDKKKVISTHIVDTSVSRLLHPVDTSHDKYLDEMVSKHKLLSKDKAVRIILDYAITSNDEATIFQVKRCVHGETCKNC